MSPMQHHAQEPGHGLRWDTRRARWWWASSQADALHAWAAGEAGTSTSRLPDGAGMLAHCRTGKLLLGFPKRLVLADAVEGAPRAPLRVKPLVVVDAAEPRTSICDGRTDRRGFLVFGTGNVASDRRPIGSFYQYSRQHGLRRLALPTVAQAAGICFSNDGTRLYFADATIGRILQCEYDAELAQVANITVFSELAHGALPRGAVVDARGCLWSAQDGRLVQYDAGGKHVLQLAIDCGAPAFGGAAMDQLVVAGATGLLGVGNALVCGVADTLFDDDDADIGRVQSTLT